MFKFFRKKQPVISDPQLMVLARKEIAEVIQNREELLSRCDLGYHLERQMALSDGSLGFYCDRCGQILRVESCVDVDRAEWLFSRANPEAYGYRSKRHEQRMMQKMEAL